MCDRVICEGPPQCPPDPEQCRRIASRPTGIARRTRSATPRFVWRPTLQPRHFSLVTSASSIGCGTRDGSDAIAFVQHTLASPVARMADYAELGGPPCGGAVFGQFVPLSGSDLRRPPRGPACDAAAGDVACRPDQPPRALTSARACIPKGVSFALLGRKPRRAGSPRSGALCPPCTRLSRTCPLLVAWHTARKG